MSDGTKVDPIRESQRAESLKPKEKVRPKDAPSEFDRVLQSQRQVVKPLLQSTTQSTTEQAVREVRREDDRHSDRRQKDDRDKEEDRQGQTREKQQEGRVSGERVVAKGKLKDDAHGGGEGESQGGGGGGTERRGAQVGLRKGVTKAESQTLSGKFEQQLRANLKGEVGSSKLTQAVLNQIVQYVRMGLNRKGEKEIQIELHEKILKGVKLRVVTKEKGRVSIAFQASDQKSKQLLESNHDALSDALAKRGIQVDEITIS